MKARTLLLLVLGAFALALPFDSAQAKSGYKKKMPTAYGAGRYTGYVEDKIPSDNNGLLEYTDGSTFRGNFMPGDYLLTPEDYARPGMRKSPDGTVEFIYGSGSTNLFGVVPLAGGTPVSGRLSLHSTRYTAPNDTRQDTLSWKVNNVVIFSAPEGDVSHITCPGLPLGSIMLKGRCVNGVPDGPV